MSRVVAMRPRIKQIQKPTLQDFKTNSIAPIEPKVEPKVEPKTSTIIDTEFSLYAPVLLNLDWGLILGNVNERLHLLATTNPTVYSKYDYMKDDTGDKDRIFIFTASGEGYSEAFNLINRNDTKKYRVRGSYKLGYRVVKQDTTFVAPSFFIELIPGTSDGDGYITYSSYQETDFNYYQECKTNDDNTNYSVDSFRLNFNFVSYAGASCMRTLEWKTSALGGKGAAPCVDIPYPTGGMDHRAIVSAFMTLNKIPRLEVTFDTFVAFEAKNNNFILHTHNIFGDTTIDGGVHSMLSGRNRKLTSMDLKTLTLSEAAHFPLNTNTTFPTPIVSDCIFGLNFAARQSGPYSGCVFTLPFSLSKADPDQVSMYTPDDTDKPNLTSVFVFFKNIGYTSERNFTLDANVKWSAERISASSAFIAPGLIAYTRDKTPKINTGDMTKLYLRDTNLEFTGPNNLHVFNLKLTLTLPQTVP